MDSLIDDIKSTPQVPPTISETDPETQVKKNNNDHNDEVAELLRDLTTGSTVNLPPTISTSSVSPRARISGGSRITPRTVEPDHGPEIDDLLDQLSGGVSQKAKFVRPVNPVVPLKLMNWMI